MSGLCVAFAAPAPLPRTFPSPRRVPAAFIALSIVSFSVHQGAAEPARELVVQTRASLSGARIEDGRAALLDRLESLGLVLRGSLSDGISTSRPPGPPGPPHPFDLDPTRVLLIEAPDSAAAAAAAVALALDPAIEWMEWNQPREPALEPGFPSDPLFRDGRQWGLGNRGPAGPYGGVAGADVHALEAWERSTGADGLRLAVADTGIDPDHPDLQAAMAGGGFRIELGINVTADPSPAFADSYGHGTAVAGVMAARSGEGAHFDSLGVAGMCGGDGRENGGCRIVPIKIAPGHSAGASSFDIARAIVYAVSVGARAVNLSYAGSGPSRVERTALFYAITRGTVVVAAAGNRGVTAGAAPQYPAAYAADGLCVQVGASDPSDRRAPFSSHGPGLDLLAPGTDIWTTVPTYPIGAGTISNGYAAASGTSFAAPFVTGAVGLLAARRPELLDTDFQHLLRESADDLGPPGVDAETGWGRLNAARALGSVPPGVGVWHDEAVADLLAPGRTDSLWVGEPGPGRMDHGGWWPSARLVEATATISLPDSFLDSVRVWPRVGGTMTVRGGFRLPYFVPWAEVAALDLEGPGARSRAAARPPSFTLRGYLYRLERCPGCEDDAHLPLPLDQARFGFTVLGRVDRPPSLELLTPRAPLEAEAGETVPMAWEASDPDEVTAIEVWLEDRRGGSIRLARLPGAQPGAPIRLPCPLPFTGPGALRVVALDEHGRRRDRASVALSIRLRPGACAARSAETALASVPNPFLSATTISAPGPGRLSIFDPSGRLVRRASLDDNVAGIRWDGRDQAGHRVGPGVYLARFEGARGREQIKVLKLE